MDTESALLAARGHSAPGPAPRARVRLALRLAGGGLLIATGAIHLDLYLTGYRSIPTIGWLFLFQVIAAFVLGAAVLASAGGYRRLRSHRWGAGRGDDAGRYGAGAAGRAPARPRAPEQAAPSRLGDGLVPSRTAVVQAQALEVVAGQRPAPGGLVRPGPAFRWCHPSAGDVKVVADVVDADGHIRGVDHCVVLGEGADVPGQ